MKDSSDEIRAIVHLSSTAVHTIIARPSTQAGKKIEILAAGVAHNNGFFGGQIRNREHLLGAIYNSMHEAMNMAGVEVFWTGLSLAMPDMVAQNIQKDKRLLHDGRPNAAGHLVTQDDVQDIFDQVKLTLSDQGLSWVQFCTQFTRLDREQIVDNAIGMRANHLAMNLHTIALPNTLHKQIVDLFASNNFEVYPWFFDGVAGAQYALTDEEKDRGVLFVDIGAGTTSICLYKENKLLFSRCLAVGGQMVDMDIASEFGLSLLEAESLKKKNGSAYPKNKSRSDFLTIKRSVGGEITIGAYELATVIEARYYALFADIINLINDEGLGGMMEAGIVLAGGAANIEGLTKLVEQNIQVNVRKMGVNDQITICAEHLSDDNVKLLQNYLTQNKLHSVLGAFLYQQSEQYTQDQYVQHPQESQGLLGRFSQQSQRWFGLLKQWI